jgi:hypothetical protein
VGPTNGVRHLTSSTSETATGATSSGTFVKLSLRMDPDTEGVETAEDYSWTIGDNQDLVHVKKIGHGGFGEVHAVRRNSNALTWF